MPTKRAACLLRLLPTFALAAAGPPPAHAPARPALQHRPSPPAAPPAAPPPEPAVAEPPRDPALAPCYDLHDYLSVSMSPAGSSPGQPAAEAVGSDGCRFSNVRIPFNRFLGYRMDSLLVRGIPPAQPAGPLQRVAFRLEARGITASLADEPPLMAWASRQRQTPFDVTLDAAYDPVAGTLALNEASMDGEVIGHTAVRATAENVRLSARAPGALPEVEGRPGLRSLHVDLDSRTILAAYTANLVATALPENDPSTAFETARAKVVATIRAVLPTAGATPDTVDAVAAFAADFPHPKHPFTLDITASSPVTPDATEAAVADPAQAAMLLKSLTVTASYTGTFR